MKNTGKIFEDDFRISVPEYCFIYRLKDSAQAFGTNKNLRFSSKNPCDFFLFDTKRRVFWSIELKSTKNKSISFELINDNDAHPKMIHAHQIKSLLELSKYEGIESGFLFNFREEDKQSLYYMNINNFMNLYNKIEKRSFNQEDLISNGAFIINGDKKRTHYKWDIEKLLSMKEVVINE